MSWDTPHFVDRPPAVGMGMTGIFRCPSPCRGLPFAPNTRSVANQAVHPCQAGGLREWRERPARLGVNQLGSKRPREGLARC